MGMAGRFAGMVILVAAVVPAYAKEYTVGDSSGWSSGVDYDAWAKGKTFNVGDTLLFQYSFMHTVAEVSSADYSACSAGNSIQSYSDQNTKISLTKPGTRYFICGASGHCANGMKLAVTVSPSDATTPASPTTPSATPSIPGTETPSEAAPSTTTPAATTPAAATPSTGKSVENTSGATDSRAHLLIGLAFGVMGLALV